MYDRNFSYTSNKEREERGFYFLQLGDSSLSPGSRRSFWACNSWVDYRLCKLSTSILVFDIVTAFVCMIYSTSWEHVLYGKCAAAVSAANPLNSDRMIESTTFHIGFHLVVFSSINSQTQQIFFIDSIILLLIADEILLILSVILFRKFLSELFSIVFLWITIFNYLRMDCEWRPLEGVTWNRRTLIHIGWISHECWRTYIVIIFSHTCVSLVLLTVIWRDFCHGNPWQFSQNVFDSQPLFYYCKIFL